MKRQQVFSAIFAVLMSVVLFGSAARAEKIWGITGSSPDDTFTGFAGPPPLPPFSVQNLVFFQSQTPGIVVTVGPISGVIGGHTLRSIDFRPATGVLYGFSTSATGAVGQLYTVNTATGVLTTVGGTIALGAGATTNNDVRAEMEWDPRDDVIRVLTASNLGPNNNFRVSPAGALLGTDSNLAYALGDINSAFTDVVIVAAAYSNNVAGASSRTLYIWDQKDDTLARVGAPSDTGTGAAASANSGQMFTINKPAFPGFTVDPSAVGMDISPSTGICFVTYFRKVPVGQQSPSATGLYTRDLTTGVIAFLGDHPAGIYVTDIAVQRTTTAATVSISGQTLTPEGRGLVGATVILQDQGGASQSVKTTKRGTFIFDGVETGRPYVLSVRSDTYVYDSQVVVVTDSLSGITFTPSGRMRPRRN